MYFDWFFSLTTFLILIEAAQPEEGLLFPNKLQKITRDFIYPPREDIIDNLTKDKKTLRANADGIFFVIFVLKPFLMNLMYGGVVKHLHRSYYTRKLWQLRIVWDVGFAPIYTLLVIISFVLPWWYLPIVFGIQNSVNILIYFIQIKNAEESYSRLMFRMLQLNVHEKFENEALWSSDGIDSDEELYRRLSVADEDDHEGTLQEDCCGRIVGKYLGGPYDVDL